MQLPRHIVSPQSFFILLNSSSIIRSDLSIICDQELFLLYCCRYKGWMAGYQMAFDVAKSQLTSNNFAVGLNGNDFALHAAV